MTRDKPEYWVVSFSGGKDSTAMLLRLLEEKMPVDEIIYCDTGLEFPEMYDHIRKVEEYTGRKITRLVPEHNFAYYLLGENQTPEENSRSAKKAKPPGLSWPGSRNRWCTQKLKTDPLSKYYKDKKKQYTIKQYIGIAADEQYRLERKANKRDNHLHPLVDWGMTEADCLQYCQQRGFDWGGLYDRNKRVSCWCCPMQSMQQLRNLRTYYPALWNQLQKWENCTWKTYRIAATVEELEVRFSMEEEWAKKGKKIRGKEFYTELAKRIGKKKISDNSLSPMQKAAEGSAGKPVNACAGA